MLRKETILRSKTDLMKDAPFYSWDCITLSIEDKWDVYLIIKNEEIMTDFLKLLIYKTESIDGCRGSAIPFKKAYMKKMRKKLCKGQQQKLSAV